MKNYPGSGQTIEKFATGLFNKYGIEKINKNDGIKSAAFIILFNTIEESGGDCLAVEGLSFYCCLNVIDGGFSKGKCRRFLCRN